MNDISGRLKIIMGKMSGREFSAALGKSPTTVNEYLHGRTPPADFIERVCERFKVDANWLLTGKEGSPPVVSEKNEYYDDLPEPVKKTVEVMRENPGMAWELYALVLERAKKARGKKD